MFSGKQESTLCSFNLHLLNTSYQSKVLYLSDQMKSWRQLYSNKTSGREPSHVKYKSGFNHVYFVEEGIILIRGFIKLLIMYSLFYLN